MREVGEKRGESLKGQCAQKDDGFKKKAERMRAMFNALNQFNI